MRVELFINGTSKGNIEVSNTKTVGAFVKEQCQSYGIRTFSVYLDGRKADSAEASQALSARQVEIVAKDARGASEWSCDSLSASDYPRYFLVVALVEKNWQGKVTRVQNYNGFYTFSTEEARNRKAEEYAKSYSTTPNVQVLTGELSGRMEAVPAPPAPPARHHRL